MLSRPHGPSGLGTDEADALSTGKVYKVAHVSPRHPGRRVSLRVRLAPRTNLRGVNPRTNSKPGVKNRCRTDQVNDWDHDQP